MVQSDKGVEFLNFTFQSMLKRHDVKFYTDENEDIKAAVVEQFNRTLKTKMYRHFTLKTPNATSTSYPICCIPTTRSIGMAPVEVDDTNEHLVRVRLYPLKPKSYKWKYDVGDRVCITMRRQPFK